MKFNIVGFNQERLIELGLDGTDALLLRWFIDFYASTDMKKYEHAGAHYGWVAYTHVVQEIPVIGIKTKDGVYRRFKKYVHKEILAHYNYPIGPNSLSCYRPDIKLDYLRWDKNNKQGRTKNRATYKQGRISIRGGSDEKPYYPSISNPSVKKNSPKKESVHGKAETPKVKSRTKPSHPAKEKDPNPPAPLPRLRPPPAPAETPAPAAMP